MVSQWLRLHNSFTTTSQRLHNDLGRAARNSSQQDRNIFAKTSRRHRSSFGTCFAASEATLQQFCNEFATASQQHRNAIGTASQLRNSFLTTSQTIRNTANLTAGSPLCDSFATASHRLRNARKKGHGDAKGKQLKRNNKYTPKTKENVRKNIIVTRKEGSLKEARNTH